jgi:uncharacterized protein (DUF983 family)
MSGRPFQRFDKKARRRSGQVVELIASGYEWTCPTCGEFNREIEIPSSVTCKKCRMEFWVEGADHAFGE